MLEGGLYRDRAVLAEQLIAVVERDGFMLTCGMVGVQYLYDALVHIGKPDFAYRMITESEPGYKTWYRHGATTLWERWAGEDDGSHNHHMFSGVIAWFYKALLGILPCEEAPAFETIELSPCFIEKVGFVRGTMQTLRGRIDAEWCEEPDGFRYTVTIPDDVCATFRGQKLMTGKNEFFVKR
jgi:alpha-L-rhamnosidase